MTHQEWLEQEWAKERGRSAAYRIARRAQLRAQQAGRMVRPPQRMASSHRPLAGRPLA